MCAASQISLIEASNYVRPDTFNLLNATPCAAAIWINRLKLSKAVFFQRCNVNQRVNEIAEISPMPFKIAIVCAVHLYASHRVWSLINVHAPTPVGSAVQCDSKRLSHRGCMSTVACSAASAGTVGCS